MPSDYQVHYYMHSEIEIAQFPIHESFSLGFSAKPHSTHVRSAIFSAALRAAERNIPSAIHIIRSIIIQRLGSKSGGRRNLADYQVHYYPGVLAY